MMAAGPAPGASAFSVRMGTSSACAVCCARTAGLTTTENRAGKRCSSQPQRAPRACDPST